MSKEELVSRLESLVTQYIEEFRVEAKHWEQKYYIAYQTNLKLEERNKVLTQEKQALLDVVSEWKSEVQSLSAVNATLLGELQELKKDKEILLKPVQNWKRNYTSIKHELDQVRKELAKADAEKLRLHCLLQSHTEELETAEERYEDFKKRSDEILATTGENLRKKQEQIEALTVWKTGAESALGTLEEELKDAIAAGKVHEETIELLVTQKQELSENLHALKQINSFQEHRIEVLSRKANKLRKKEQND